MKSGKSLQELAQELDRQRTEKRDFLADTRAISVEPDDDSPTKISFKLGDERYPLNRHALRQACQKTGVAIGAQFADGLIGADAADLLAHNIGELFKRMPEKRMLRTLDGKCRAVVSESYRPLDNFDFAQAILPVLQQERAEVQSCDVTETKLYIKAIFPGRTETVAAEGHFMGDGGHNPIHELQPGLVASNSEVGAGALCLMPGIHEVKCSNLATFARDAMRKYHVGRKQSQRSGVRGRFQYDGGDGNAWALLSDETRETQDRGFWMEVRDLARLAVAGELYERHLNEVRASVTGKRIELPSEAVIQELPGQLSQAERSGILEHLIHGGDFSKFGMQAAVTRFSADVEDYDRATELEQLGGQIITLKPRDWERVAVARAA